MEEPKITTVEKVKDPRRVVQGKRLGAISKQAKAKKAQERLEQQQEQQQEQQEESANLPCFLLVVIIGGAIATVGCYCYSKKKEEPASVKEQQQPEKANTVNRPSRIENF